MHVLYLIFLSVLQGVTELFPVSSLGHTLLVPALFGAAVDTQAPQLIPFLVTLHLGTAVALVLAFRARWKQLALGTVRHLQGRRNPEGRLTGLLLLATVPAGVLGLLLQHPLDRLFHDVRLVALVLMVNGAVLILGERVRARHNRRAASHHPASYHPAGQPLPGQPVSGRRSLDSLTAAEALWIGVSQVFALIPGVSRSGFTLVTGLVLGLERGAAAEFAFLLGTPIILAATALELPKLFHDHGALKFALLGGVLTGVAAYLSARFLMQFFGEGRRLTGFGVYCLVFGAASLLWLTLRA